MVRSYIINDLASDSEDDKKITRAEYRAVRQIKQRKVNYKKNAPAIRSHPYSLDRPAYTGYARQPFLAGQHNKKPGSCYNCGDFTGKETVHMLPEPIPAPQRVTSSRQQTREATDKDARFKGPDPTTDMITDKYICFYDATCTPKDFEVAKNCKCMLTHCYFDYEHFNVEIIVKSRLKRNIQFWINIGSYSYILAID